MDTTHSASATYEAVARLALDAQRELLRTGTPLEQLWSAWAQGMQAGAAALPALRLTVAETPVPGLRRHLVIVLAGLGERHLVEVLALHDPDDMVRATAGEHLVRIAVPPAEHVRRVALDRLLWDEAARVRAAVLQEWLRRVAQQQLPPLPDLDLVRLAGDDDLEVRRLALSALLAGKPPDEVQASSLPLLERRLGIEPDSDLRRWIAERLLEAGHAQAVLRAVRGDAGPRDEELLHTLVNHEHRFRWADLAPLARFGRPALDVYLLRLLRPAETAAASWLLACIMRAHRWIPPKNRDDWKVYQLVQDSGWAAEERLTGLLPHLGRAQLTAQDREACHLLAAALENGLVEGEEDLRQEWEDIETNGPAGETGIAEALAALREEEWYQRSARLAATLRRLAE